MDFRTGNSGNHLREVVLKVGPGVQQEGAFCQHLGRDVAPEIITVIPNGYVMEKLHPAQRTRHLLREIESLLFTRVWIRPALPISNDVTWREKLQAFGVVAPEHVIDTDPCLVHGDPTASNALRRGDDLVMCDPRPPRDFIPQNRETDMGRIIQSMFWWEVAAYGVEHVDFCPPHFMAEPHYRKAAMFWCGAAAARIEYLERSRDNRAHILDWCRKTRSNCGA